MINDTTLLGATDTAWIRASEKDRRNVIRNITEHAKDSQEAAEFFRMITGHEPGSETQR